MSAAVNPVPEGISSVNPYFAVHGVAKLVDFLQKTFNAVELYGHSRPDGEIGHAILRIGTSTVMMGELPAGRQPMLAMLYVYVDDVDAAWRRAIEAGGVSVMEPKDQFYGDRNGAVNDPCGNQWWIGSQREKLSSEEIERRAKEQGSAAKSS